MRQGTFRQFCYSLMLGAIAWGSDAKADTYLHHASGDSDSWRLTATGEVFSSSLEGNLTNIGRIPANQAGSFSASGSTLNLSRESIGQIRVAASNRRWSLGLQFLPVEYSRNGSGLVAVTSGGSGGFVSANVESDLSINFAMAEAR